jgi:hypothetical protein
MLETTFLLNAAMGSGLFVAPLLIGGGLIGLTWLRLPRRHRAFVSLDGHAARHSRSDFQRKP